MARKRGWKIGVASALLLAMLGIGCGPSTLAMLFLPFMDDKMPPRCKLANADKEINVVVATRFSSLEVRPEIMTADQELAESLAQQIRTRSKENKEKVKVVAPIKVRPHLLKLKEWDHSSLLAATESFKADYVILVEIQKLSLVMPNSFNSLYQGNADLEVTVLDTKQPALESVAFKEAYRCEFPKSRPIDTSGSSPSQFRMMFVNKVARDLARWFVAYPSDQRFELE